MFLDNYHHLKKKEIYTLVLLVLFSIFVRIPAIFIFGDTNLDYEWGVLVINIIREGANAGNIEELITELEVKEIFKKVLNTETLSIDNRIIIL